MEFNSGKELIALCEEKNLKIWEVMIQREKKLRDEDEKILFHTMKENLLIMQESVKKGLYEDVVSNSGLVGGDAKKIRMRYEREKTVSGISMNMAIASAMAVLEVNASMGKVVAAPTAGSSGIIPAALTILKKDFDLKDEELVKGLFTASAIGYIISKNATVAGAEGGCQAETGSAAAMAAALIVDLLGGSAKEALSAGAMTIKNILGLVCDPIAGLVEAPCIKRNALGIANAMICADMALSGVLSIIPFDEVVETMYRVGKDIPHTLRETAKGGLAITPTGLEIQRKIFEKEKEE